MSYLKSAGTTIIYIGLFLTVITFLPGLPPHVEFKEYSVTPSRMMELKNRLNSVQKLFIEEIHGPESFDSYNGKLYTGVHGGYILRIEDDYTVPIVKFGQKCDGIWQEHKCGRPLGLKFDKKGNLYVADAYYGIFKVNVTNGEYENIVNISKPIEGQVSKLPNSIDIAENGDLYWTDSSTTFHLYDIMMDALTNPSGRFIRYNAIKKKNEVLMRNLSFTNGVLLSDDESFVIVAESLLGRIMKYNLKGPKAGQQEIFIDGLPGVPDNIHSDGQGGFLVSLVILINSEHPLLSQSLAPHPYLRKMLTRLALIIELPFKILHDIYYNIYTEKILHSIGMFIAESEKSIVLRIDASGNIIEAISADDGSFNYISSAYIFNDYLWFGSPWLKYLSRIPLKQAFPELAASLKQSRTETKKQSSNASNIKMEKIKQNAESTTAKPNESNRAKTEATTASTTSKSNTTPKPSSTPKEDKSTIITNNDKEKPLNDKSSPNIETKKKTPNMK